MSENILRDVVLPAAFNKNGSKFVDCEFDKKYEAQDNFQSSVFFLSATVEKEGNTVKIPLVVKFQPKDERVRKELNISVQFYNEIVMYREFLPFINKNGICEDIFPAFYYGLGTLTEPDKDVIVIEDLRPKGFRLTDVKGFIEYGHLKIAMEKLGRFHALSYIAKIQNPTEFYRLVGKLKESSWVNEDSMINPTIQKCFHRALDPLIPGRAGFVACHLRARVDESVVRFVQELVAPEEPMAVLCHGDFCRNNMLFKYNSDGEPDDVRFFDVATARYSSPVVDIAFFLLMNSTASMRTIHWDELLSVYHAALSSSVRAISPEAWVPTLPRLQEEMKLKAVYGFVHASFFLPMMLWGDEVTMDDISDVSPDEMGGVHAELGGEEGTKLLMDMVLELVDRKCLTLQHPFLKDVKVPLTEYL